MFACVLLIVLFSAVCAELEYGREGPPISNWTFPYDGHFAADFALDFASASYADDPTACIEKHGLKLAKRSEVYCDSTPWDKCIAYVAYNESFIVFSVRGTTTKLQLIAELVETMTAPKRKFVWGSVQRYFRVALTSIYHQGGYKKLLKKLKATYPNATMLFTGHSLGAAIVSLASSLYASDNPHVPPSHIRLITFGQPRVGNMEYARGHDLFVPNSWRIVHRFDIVAHLPYCYETLWSHQCTPLFNHGPQHHGTEIWYLEAMNPDFDLFRICTGQPLNEDSSCSNGKYIHFDVNDHLVYFGKDVSANGVGGCPVEVNNELSLFH
ncbi:Triacylglycerol lipase [Aphelenchoides fujianensis]|nr:Triacylglycerol lipase [Aphelenchoides fujianensis]